MINSSFWKNKKVFITGHTGFKGSWLSLWLNLLGAEVTGYALPPPTTPSLFSLCGIETFITSITGDIRNLKFLQKAVHESTPEIVIHMAAQPLVHDSYDLPVETYEINVMGTVNLLESIKSCPNVKAVLNITTDKCYENKESLVGYREHDRLGGYDPYSNSKACSELITSAFRTSYFNTNRYDEHGVALATARAGNVIGGGDWAANRLIADLVRAILKNKNVKIRNPNAVRPWQHVLEPLSGYLSLSEKLYNAGPHFSEAWNFGPDESGNQTVEWVVKKFCKKWGDGANYEIDDRKHPHETNFLQLDCSKAKAKLDWHPKWTLTKAIDSIVEWTKAYQGDKDVKEVCLKQIIEYESYSETAS